MAFLVAQMVKNPPATRETWVQSLGREEPLVESMAAHSSILFFFFKFIYFFICSEFCHTLKWKGLGFTCLPHPDLAWRIPWTEASGGQSMGWQRVRHGGATKCSTAQEGTERTCWSAPRSKRLLCWGTNTWALLALLST